MTLIKLLNDTIENKTENYFKEFLHNELWDKYQAIQNIDCNSKNPVIAYETCILESTIQKGYITAIEDRCASCIETLYKEFCVKN